MNDKSDFGSFRNRLSDNKDKDIFFFPHKQEIAENTS
ncbi:hypothetical protein SAMN05421866_1739 [Chryseobacterium oranimense]|jgi:hypothetical protein|uniref:Uncharacterized protein n=1 Tax=Chryseobacterium oranimense TaxID=421058 RepID=A0A1M5PAJ2_9FLAO|nr:hypothetical protein SAMN05421866_1739 [Chryseobacterium oranimense]